MVKCSQCGMRNVDNTIFCGECGYYLLEDDTPATDEIHEPDWLGDTTKRASPAASIQSKAILQTIRLKIGGNKREVEMPLNKDIHLGRVDAAANIFPEIDLTDDDTLGKSVSRRHARILKQKELVLVEDLGSINGTFVNGKRLAPYLPKPLNHGDTLQLGRLLIEVKILKQ